MNSYVALLRGINVGGRNLLPMQALRALLEELGLHNVKTYIQSGNVVFQSGEANLAALATRISEQIEASHGFAPHVLLLPAADLQQAIAANPFPEAESEPKSLHVGFRTWKHSPH